jgi:hypothetical protein
MLRSLGLITALALALPCSVRAAPLSAPALHWVRGQGAETCVEPRGLSEIVETLLSAPLVRGAEAAHSIEGIVERSAQGFHVALRLVGARGELLGTRTLDQPGESCSALAQPVAFVIAMMIDPEVVAHGLPPELLKMLGEEAPEQKLLAELEREPPRPVALPARDQNVRAESTPAPKTAAGSEATAPYVLSVALGAAVLASPRAAPTGQLLATRRVGRLVSLGAFAWGGAQLGVERVREGRGFRLAMFSASALLCVGGPADPRLVLAACVGPGLWLRHASGSGIGEDRRTTLLQAEGVAVLHTRVRVRRQWILSALVGVEVPLSRPRLTYLRAEGERAEIYDFSPVTLSFGIGPSYEF